MKNLFKQEDKPKLIDLGLPSRNLWMRNNLGAKTEADYGNYYQFGDLFGYQGKETRKHSSWNTCPFNNGDNIFNYEYFKVNRHKWFYKNGLLKPEFDAVTQTYGKRFKIPTDKDFKELLDNTTTKIVENYKNSGNNGRLFTSRINGNSIFIPFSGFIDNNDINNISCGRWCCPWSGRIDPRHPSYAYGLYCTYTRTELGYIKRYYGLALRGIKVRDE